MKKQGHPPYQEILFVDTATGDRFICGSTLQPRDKETFEGKEYPAFKVPISSSSHPFFTGSQQFVDSEGRVEKFKKRYTRAPQSPAAETAAPELKGEEKKKAMFKKAAEAAKIRANKKASS